MVSHAAEITAKHRRLLTGGLIALGARVLHVEAYPGLVRLDPRSPVLLVFLILAEAVLNVLKANLPAVELPEAPKSQVLNALKLLGLGKPLLSRDILSLKPPPEMAAKPFLAPGPSWQKLFSSRARWGGKALASRRSHRICQAKNSPTPERLLMTPKQASKSTDCPPPSAASVRRLAMGLRSSWRLSQPVM